MIRSALLDEFDKIVHAFTNRSGGVSETPFDALNLAYHVGDDPAAVDHNQRILAKWLGYDASRLVHMRQIHSDRVVACVPDMGFESQPECDALITDIPGQPLMVMTADCTPLLLFDPVRQVIAAVHAGRAGALKNIVAATIGTMGHQYGSAPENLYAVLGPSIHACCYEVGPEVADEVAEAGYKSALQLRKERFYLDVNAIVLSQLEREGVLASQIEIIDACTSCNAKTLFSHRAHKGSTGRQAGVIMLK